MFFDNKNKNAAVISEAVESKKGKLSTKTLLLGLVALIVLLVLAVAWVVSSVKEEPKKPVQQPQNNNATAMQSSYQAPPPLVAENTIADEEALKRVREQKAKQVNQKQEEPKQDEITQENSNEMANKAIAENSINASQIDILQINSEQITGEIKNAIKEAFEELKVQTQIPNLREEIKPKIKENKAEATMKVFLLKEQENFKLKGNSLLYKNKLHYIGDFIEGYEIIDIESDYVVFYDKNENWNYKLNFKE